LKRGGWRAGYSLLDRAAEREMFPLCAETGVGFTAFSPLAGGWLSGKYRAAGAYPEGSRMTLRPEPYRHLESEQVFRGLAAFADEAGARGVDMTALAIAWVLHHPRVDAAIIGPRTAAHLDAALPAAAHALSDADADRLANLF
jgi:aryl-alcohol dehydrogenase-like predicted oxidoreductase